MKYFLGIRKEDNAKIYMDAPEWGCGWYWSFGYLGNSREHYHLKEYQDKQVVLTDGAGQLHVINEKRNINMYDALTQDYNLNDKIISNLWQFCELALTYYTLKEAAEVLGRGGSHMTTNPSAETIKNADEVKRINEVVIPELNEALEAIFNGEVKHG